MCVCTITRRQTKISECRTIVGCHRFESDEMEMLGMNEKDLAAHAISSKINTTWSPTSYLNGITWPVLLK